MTWKIKNGTSLIEILEDDITFYAILKRGVVEHTKVDNVYDTKVCAKDIASGISFYMSLLESSMIEEFFPQFALDGVMGKWKLSPPKTGDYPLVQLVSALPDVNKFLELSRSKQNPEWIRTFYYS